MRRTTLIALAVLLSTASAVVFYVHPDSTQDSIQPCLDMCSTGDTVLVGAGTYYENIIWPDCQGVKLLSEFGRDTTVIDGGGTGRVVHVRGAVDTTTVVSGFTIKNGYTDFGNGAGVRCDTNSSPLICDNWIAYNIVAGLDSMAHGAGVGTAINSSPVIRDNIISHNQAVGTFTAGGGVWCMEGCAPLITGNVIEHNTATAGGGGVMCYNGSSAVISGNTIQHNHSDVLGGGLCTQRTASVVFGNRFTQNDGAAGGGIGVGVGDSSTIRGNTVEANAATEAGGGIACAGGLAVVDSNFVLLNNTQGNGGGIAFWTGSIATISRNRLCGNTADSCGGGIYCMEFSNPAITGNEIDSNLSRVAGGGIYCGGASPSIRHNAITNNRAMGYPAGLGGGIACLDYSAPVVYGNTIEGNVAGGESLPGGGTGGGIYCDGHSAARIIRDTIASNRCGIGVGGGICCRMSDCVVDSCVIQGNSVLGGAGGIAVIDCSPTITNNLLASNVCSGLGATVYGGGILCERSAALISKNTITLNRVQWGFGGGIHCDDATPTIDSCIIRDNEAGGITCANAATPAVHSNDITDNVRYGVGNLDSTVVVDAEDNWWGHSTGPFHPDSNPSGRGDTVSDYVDFEPWLGTPVGIVRGPLLIDHPHSFPATIVHSTLPLPTGADAELLDIAGRKVMDLQPGLNDIRHVAPGIYFVRRPETEDERSSTDVRKVVIQR